MDPNATRDRIKALIAEINDNSLDKDANELAELFENLDEWLTMGGFPPRAWNAPNGKK